MLLLAPPVPAAPKSSPVPSQSSKSRAAGAKAPAGSTKGRAKKSKRSRSRGVARQTAPDPARTREIQEALRREHYLDGPASGKWDQATREAMARFQKDQGFPATGKPDARSLIKLGLGPKHENTL